MIETVTGEVVAARFEDSPIVPLPFPLTLRRGIDPPEILFRLQQEAPLAPVVLPGGTPAVLLTRWDDVRAMLHERRLSRNVLSKPTDEEIVPFEPSSIAADCSEHSTPYQHAGAAFGASALAEFRPVLEHLADDLINRLIAHGPPADLASLVARPFAENSIGTILGIPEDDRRWLREMAPLVSVESPSAASVEARNELFAYFESLIPRGGNGLIFSLATTGLSAPTLVSLCLRICMAGIHTIHVAVSKGTVILLRQPDAFQALRTRPDMVGSITEELLRLGTPILSSLPRMASEDVSLPSGRISARTIVVASLEAANRDSRYFDDPHRISLRRHTAQHMSFGFGGNYCFGSGMARAEMETVFTALARRLPGLKLHGTENDIRMRPGVLAPDPFSLPVNW